MLTAACSGISSPFSLERSCQIASARGKWKAPSLKKSLYEPTKPADIRASASPYAKSATEVSAASPTNRGTFSGRDDELCDVAVGPVRVPAEARAMVNSIEVIG